MQPAIQYWSKIEADHWLVITLMYMNTVRNKQNGLFVFQVQSHGLQEFLWSMLEEISSAT